MGISVSTAKTVCTSPSHCSSHRSISSCDSATNWPIQAEYIDSKELFFASPFGSQSTVREPLASSQDRPLSYPLGTPSLKNTLLLLASHTLPTNSRTSILTDDTKRDTFSLLLLYTCYYNKPFVVVFFKRSFVIHLCCQITYSIRETNHFQSIKPWSILKKH